MLKKHTAKCIEQAEAAKICTYAQCLKHSFICFSENCDCQYQHQNCIFQTKLSDVNYLLDCLTDKNESGAKCFQVLLQFCDSSIKQFIILKETISQIIEKENVFLEPSEKYVMNYLKNNSLEIVNGKITASAISSLKTNPKVNVEEIKKMIDNSIQKSQKKIQEIISSLLNIVSLGNKKNSQNSTSVQTIKDFPFQFEFSTKYYANTMRINHNTVTCIRRGFDQQIHFLLIESSESIFSIQDTMITFRINRANETYLGIGFLKQMTYQQFKTGEYDNKRHPLGYFVNFNHKKQINSEQNFEGWSDGDLVHMILSDNVFTIINSTDGTLHTKQVKIKEKEKVYYCIGIKNCRNRGSISLRR